MEKMRSSFSEEYPEWFSAEMLVGAINLTKYFYVSRGFLRKPFTVHAVDGLTFYIKQGETLGLVGETGCGKSTTGFSLIYLLKPTSGKVYFDGIDLSKLKTKQLNRLRKEMQIVFQNPFSSLNPRMNVRAVLEEPFIIHNIGTTEEREEEVIKLLEVVGLSAEHLDRYPHEFSGGQRQRLGFARTLALKPQFIVCDEPVSMLDVSIQAQILNLMTYLKDKMGLTYLFIAHDLSVVKHISDRVAVMYLGKIVEISPKKAIYGEPLHPYTKALMSAIPVPNPRHKPERIILKGEVPSPITPPTGCRFHTRCFQARSRCSKEEPPLIEIEEDRYVACWYVQ